MSPAAPSSKGDEVGDGGCRHVVDRFPETPYFFLPRRRGSDLKVHQGSYRVLNS